MLVVNFSPRGKKSVSVSSVTAIKLKKQCPDAEVFIWEKEKAPGLHQSTHNSGVLHAGLYYKPRSGWPFRGSAR